MVLQEDPLGIHVRRDVGLAEMGSLELPSKSPLTAQRRTPSFLNREESRHQRGAEGTLSKP